MKHLGTKDNGFFYCSGEDHQSRWYIYHFREHPLIDTRYESRVWWALEPESFSLLGGRLFGGFLPRWWLSCADPERWGR